jgi:NAD(P)-dependent dehydrogenase (short-subunit alcohol dehydrogenase family)
MLQDKNAIIYGGGGHIGGAVAKAFAEAGARVFLAGRTKEKLDAVAETIRAAGGQADVAVVDATDERAVEAHLAEVVAAAGSVDVSMNLVNRGDVQGTPLVAMPVADVVGPVTTGLTANFVTARAAANQMAGQDRGGVILLLNSGSAKGSPMMGATGLVDAALDTLVRNLALEAGPQGVRVNAIWTAGLPETLSKEALKATNPAMDLDDAAFQGLLDNLAGMRATRRSPRLSEIAATATFLASDGAAAITGTCVNATSGMFV